MAEVVKSAEGIFMHGRGMRYPWEQWFDGRVWKLQRGTDFTVNPTSMAMAIYQRAWRAGGTAKVRKDLDAGIVYLQYTAPKVAAKRIARSAP